MVMVIWMENIPNKNMEVYFCQSPLAFHPIKINLEQNLKPLQMFVLQNTNGKISKILYFLLN